MKPASLWAAIASHISQVTGQALTVEATRPVGGGCINDAYQISGTGQTYFVKLNQARQLSMFSVEALGLDAIAATKTITVPRPVCYGVEASQSYLVLEWLDFGRASTDHWRVMGQQLARLHLAGGSTQYGWQQDNVIGSTPQRNSWENDWAIFFAEHRIGFQLELARRKGGNFSQPRAVIPKIQALLDNRQPPPSLVHGDLWSGNAAVLTTGGPVILDPAVYYGDPEVDIAMTELFGGFPASFYQGYNTVLALDPGYQHRKTLYNLYHILNHFNLFGGGYEQQAQQMLKRCLN